MDDMGNIDFYLPYEPHHEDLYEDEDGSDGHADDEDDDISMDDHEDEDEVEGLSEEDENMSESEHTDDDHDDSDPFSSWPGTPAPVDEGASADGSDIEVVAEARHVQVDNYESGQEGGSHVGSSQTNGEGEGDGLSEIEINSDMDDSIQSIDDDGYDTGAGSDEDRESDEIEDEDEEDEEEDEVEVESEDNEMHSPYGFDALDEIDDDEPLFVARERRRNAVRPLEELLSNVRRNHERALGIMSELHSHHRDFAQRNASVDNMPREGQNHRAGRQRQHDQVVLDELVEVEMSRAPGPSRQQRNSQREPPVFIDLTEEPDSPEVPRAMPPPRTRGANPSQPPVAGRNPRRQTALNRRTPSFSRSDGSLLGDQTNVIDLTLDDSPAAPAPLPQQLPRRNHPEIPPHHRHHLRHHQLHGHQNNNHNQHSFRNRQQAAAAAAAAGRDRDIDAAAAENFGARFAGLIRNIDIFQRLGFGRAIPDVEVQYLGAHQNNNGNNNMDNPIAGNLPHLDYRFGGAGGAAAAVAAAAAEAAAVAAAQLGRKPNYEPPPPAREGFTRNTGGGNDEVIICPSCERELKYDPDAGADGRRPVKKVKTRKDQEVHHFWALKDCGHVYCKECYENRRVGSKSSAVRFRRDLTHARRNLCAVPDCPTEANNKGNWVGLFL